MTSAKYSIGAGAVRAITAAHVLRSKPSAAGLVSIAPGKKIIEAMILMELREISELPVVESGRVVGNFSDLILARLLHGGTPLNNISVAEVMEGPLFQVDLSTDVLDVYRLLKEGRPGLIVTDDEAPVGFLNRLDLIDYWKGRGLLERSTA